MSCDEFNDPLRLSRWSKSWTLYDAVSEYAKDRKLFTAGEQFTLPDVDQEYTVLGVGFFGKKGERKRPLIKLTAVCAVRGCHEAFVTTKQPGELRKPNGIVRTCKTHRGLWRTPAKHPWMPGEERDKRLAKEGDVAAQEMLDHYAGVVREPKPVAPPKVRAHKIGAVEAVLLKVLRSADVLGLDEAGVVATAASQMPRSDGLQDQRRFIARRALASLKHKGLTGSLV